MSRTQIFSLVTVLAILSIFLLWPSDEAPPIQPAEEIATEAEQTPDLAEVEVVAAPAEAAEAGNAPPQRTETEAAPDSAPEGVQAAVEGVEGVAVRTMEQSSGDPLPNTDVYALYPSDYDESELEAKFQSGNATLEEICMEYGVRYRTDETGVTAVRRPMDNGAVLFARNGGQTTLAFNLDPNAEEWVLSLEPDFEATVRVTHADGSPAAKVPVALRSRSQTYSFDLMKQATNAEGIAEFKNLNVFLNDRAGPSGDLFLGLAMLLPDEVAQKKIHQTPLPLDNPKAGPFDLQLPEYGSVKLRLIDQKGEIVADDCFATLTRTGSTGGAMGGPMRNSEVRGKVEQGEHEFPYVALDAQISVLVNNNTGELGEPVKFAGPRQAGEVVEVDFVVDDRCIIHGLLTYANGTPVANVKLDARAMQKTDGGQLLDRMRVKTDDHGAFRLSIPGVSLGKPPLARSIILVKHPRQGPSLRCELELPTQLPRGELDLGEHQLIAMPLALAGRVVNDQGEPVSNALMQLKSKFTAAEHAQTYWQSVQGGQSRSDADGRFEIYAKVEDSALQLVTEASGYTRFTMSVHKGQDDVEVNLLRGAFLAGTVWLDASVPAKHMRVRAETKTNGEQNSIYHEESALVPKQGVSDAYEFRLDDLQAGVATLVLVGPQFQNIKRTPDVVIQPGLDCTPAEWKDLDLRGRLKNVELRLLDHAGNAVHSEAEAFLRSGNSVRAQNGTVSLFLIDGMEDINIVASGYRVKELSHVSQSQDVVLQDGLDIRLSLSTTLSLAEGVSIRAFLSPDDGGHVGDENADEDWQRPSYSQQIDVEFRADGTVDFRLPKAGKYLVHPIAVFRNPETGATTYDYFGSSSQIEISEQVGTQSFDLEFDRQKMDEVLEKHQ
jgi:hypothetical protein